MLKQHQAEAVMDHEHEVSSKSEAPKNGCDEDKTIDDAIAHDHAEEERWVKEILARREAEGSAITQAGDDNVVPIRGRRAQR